MPQIPYIPQYKIGNRFYGVVVFGNGFGGKEGLAQRFSGFVQFIHNAPAPLARGKFDVKVLRGEFGDFKRLRAGNYRIIFDDEGNIMLIYEIKHRQEAYHD